LAPYKKRPKVLAPIWSFWMRADFCWFPTSAEPGLPEDGPRFCDMQVTGARSRPSRRSVFPQKGGALPCMLSFIQVRTSKTPKFRSFWCICSDTCEVLCFSFGIMAGSTEGTRSENALRDIPACIQNGFQDMHRNSTPPSLSGTILSDLWQTVFQRIWSILSSSLMFRFIGYNGHVTCFGLVSMPLIYHGDELSITFA
jgi:hypothetical protein